mmetsp:Transcript_32273/g.75891  ORF Transcript_32273/g.75891 Transcript_32273/m.75891 type:complete len:251 (-) Transcript_32273:2-754(-)
MALEGLHAPAGQIVVNVRNIEGIVHVESECFALFVVVVVVVVVIVAGGISNDLEVFRRRVPLAFRDDASRNVIDGHRFHNDGTSEFQHHLSAGALHWPAGSGQRVFLHDGFGWSYVPAHETQTVRNIRGESDPALFPPGGKEPFPILGNVLTPPDGSQGLRGKRRRCVRIGSQPIHHGCSLGVVDPANAVLSVVVQCLLHLLNNAGDGRAIRASVRVLVVVGIVVVGVVVVVVREDCPDRPGRRSASAYH